MLQVGLATVLSFCFGFPLPLFGSFGAPPRAILPGWGIILQKSARFVASPAADPTPRHWLSSSQSLSTLVCR